MDLINTYLYLNYIAIFSYLLCLLVGIFNLVFKDVFFLIVFAFVLSCTLNESLSFLLSELHIRTHFLNYFLSLNYFVILLLIVRKSTSNKKELNYVFLIFIICVALLICEFVSFGKDKMGGISAVVAFFWVIFIIGYLMKQLILKEYDNYQNNHFWVYISILIVRLLTIGEKGFGDMLIESNLINTLLVVAIIGYLGIIISNIIFIYTFFLYSKK